MDLDTVIEVKDVISVLNLLRDWIEKRVQFGRTSRLRQTEAKLDAFLSQEAK